MKLVQILLPVRDNRGRKFKRAVYPAGPLWLDACPEYEIIFGAPCDPLGDDQFAFRAMFGRRRRRRF
jgi:hypothetical protein